MDLVQNMSTSEALLSLLDQLDDEDIENAVKEAEETQSNTSSTVESVQPQINIDTIVSTVSNTSQDNEYVSNSDSETDDTTKDPDFNISSLLKDISYTEDSGGEEIIPSSQTNLPLDTESQTTPTSLTDTVPQDAPTSLTDTVPQDAPTSITYTVPQDAPTSITNTVPQGASTSLTDTVPQGASTSLTDTVPQGASTGDTDVEEEIRCKKPRKRQRQPEKWARVIKKKAHARGERYTNTKGNVTQQKSIGPDCNCKRKCFEKLGNDHISLLFRQFY